MKRIHWRVNLHTLTGVSQIMAVYTSVHIEGGRNYAGDYVRSPDRMY